MVGWALLLGRCGVDRVLEGKEEVNLNCLHESNAAIYPVLLRDSLIMRLCKSLCTGRLSIQTSFVVGQSRRWAIVAWAGALYWGRKHTKYLSMVVEGLMAWNSSLWPWFTRLRGTVSDQRELYRGHCWGVTVNPSLPWILLVTVYFKNHAWCLISCPTLVSLSVWIPVHPVGKQSWWLL